jgi:PAS domain-containing protein
VENTRLMFKGPLGPKEYRLVLKPGESVACEINGDVLRDPQGVPYGMVFVARDIAQRKRAEETLRTREAQLRETQRMAKLGRWELTFRTNSRGRTRSSAFL